MLGFILNNITVVVPAYLTLILLFLGVMLTEKLSRKFPAIRYLLKPIDGNNIMFDRRRIIGDHKPMAGWLMPLIAAIASHLLLGQFTTMLVISYSSFFGDLAGSFLKRRLGIAEHKPLIFVDQLSFFMAAWLAALATGIRIPAGDLVLLSSLTFLLHFAGNMALFILKLKSRPY